MKIISTADLTSAFDGLNSNEIYWTYNGLDCCLTSEISAKLRAKMDPIAEATYQRELRLQAPVMEMMMRGLRVDDNNKQETIAKFEAEIAQLKETLARLLKDGCGFSQSVNPASPLQVKTLFYDQLQLPVVRERNAAGRSEPSSSRTALEHLAAHHFIAQPFVNIILAIRERGKALGFLRSKLDDRGRFTTSLNITGTNTGRLSSSYSDFGTGSNLQNVDRSLRYIFVPDPGYVFVNVDLEQADSRNVGALCWNLCLESKGADYAGAYLDACEGGDLHTQVARMVWDDLPWGDKSNWRNVADVIFYRQDSYRQTCKRLGHGSNYLGKPRNMSEKTHIPVQLVKEFQRRYFSAFPAIPDWQADTKEQLKTTGMLTTPFGRRRMFFDRLDANPTLNAAIAYKPQSMTGDAINDGLCQAWEAARPAKLDIQALLQVHDSILWQVPIKDAARCIDHIMTTMPVSLTLAGGRPFTIPLEAKVGFNWSDSGPDNPHGLAKWKGQTLIPPPLKKKLSFTAHL